MERINSNLSVLGTKLRKLESHVDTMELCQDSIYSDLLIARKMLIESLALIDESIIISKTNGVSKNG